MKGVEVKVLRFVEDPVSCPRTLYHPIQILCDVELRQNLYDSPYPLRELQTQIRWRIKGRQTDPPAGKFEVESVATGRIKVQQRLVASFDVIHSP
jgi:hypothetical protein